MLELEYDLIFWAQESSLLGNEICHLDDDVTDVVFGNAAFGVRFVHILDWHGRQCRLRLWQHHLWWKHQLEIPSSQ